MNTSDPYSHSRRLGGLRRFAVAITVLNILGHTLFGFEQSWAQPLVALATAYGVEVLLEITHAWAEHRAPRFVGGPQKFVDFLLSAHISGLAVAMLLYANEQLWPIAFGAAVAIASKSIFRAPHGRGTLHYFNPSNFGITVTLLCFPWVGIAPPYHFTENLSGAGDWLLPAVIVCSGSLLNAKFTRRLPLIGAWLGTFVAQAFVRSLWFDTSLASALLPMTGVAFLLYTFYMVTDPATTPGDTKGQLIFGAAVAVAYGLLLVVHVVFGLFFALTIVCAARGVCMYVHAWVGGRAPAGISVRPSSVAKEV